jgi:hypothetical protein
MLIIDNNIQNITKYNSGKLFKKWYNYSSTIFLVDSTAEALIEKREKVICL